MPDPTALESNPAGTLHLIESGCYGFTGTRANGYQFDDASLSDWTDRFSDGIVSVSGGTLTSEKNLLLMWNKPSVSPQHTLPNNQIITTLRGRWNLNGNLSGADYHTNSVAIMSVSPLPWQAGGFMMGEGGKIFFTELWHTWSYENGSFQSYHTGQIGEGNVDHWQACRVKPDATGGCDCSAGGLNLIQGAHGNQPDAAFTWCVCDSGNYALAGNPGLVSWRFGSGFDGDGTEYYEWHAFFDTSIKVIGLPTGWKAKVIKVGDAVRKAADHTQSESGGEAVVTVVGTEDMPPWDEVQVLDGSNVVQHTIQVRTFQPGTYGGDVYTMGPVDNPPVTPPAEPCIVFGDCEEGISVTYPDCDEGISVTYPDCEVGLPSCPPS